MTTTHNITMCVRTWFDKKNGNTYFTVHVVFDGDINIYPDRMVYGFGISAYCEEAARMINNYHLGPIDMDTDGNLVPLTGDAVLNKHRTIIDEARVPNRKNLHGCGFFKGRKQ